jgi:Ca2+-binding RTX toxin-like protein
MTIFTAEAAFDTPDFIGSGSISELFELGTPVTATASVFALQHSDGGTTELLTLTGSFGDYVDGFPTTGMISHIAFAVNGVGLFSFANAAITVEQFTAFVQADNIAQLFAALLAGADEVRGSAGNDVLQGFAGDDSLTGGDGDDTLDGGTGADSMAGGMGNDIYVIDQAGDATHSGDGIIELAGEGIDEIRTSVNWGLGGTNVENITATGSGNIFLGGSEVANVMTGNVGDNYFVGDGGNDTIDGGDGRDVASFNLPAGTLGNLVVVDGTGADAGTLLVQLVDGANIETVARVTLNGIGSATIEGLGQGAFWGTDTVTDIEELHFLENTTDGTNATNIAFIFLAVRQFGEFVDGSDAADTIDLATFAGALNANGGRGNDVISGTEAANNLSGGLGHDVLRGLGGNDFLAGDSGDDTLEGGLGDDYLIGGAGNDSVDGGTGSNDIASFLLPAGTPGTIAVVDGSGADAGKLLVQITDGGVTQTILRVTLTALGAATVEGVGIGAFMGTDTVVNVDQLHIFVNTAPPQDGYYVGGSDS